MCGYALEVCQGILNTRRVIGDNEKNLINSAGISIRQRVARDKAGDFPK